MNNITPFTPSDIISLHHGQPMTTSLKVAEVFGKRHDNVIKKIESLDCPLEFMSANFSAHVENQQVGVTRRDMKHYEMTKDGFMLLVMGFTGKPAMATKIAFINAFNWMAEQLAATPRPQQAVGLTDDELCTLAWLWRAADRMMDATRNIYPLLKVAEHREASRYYAIIHEYPHTLHQARKILADRSRHIQPDSHGDTDWPKLIPHLRREPKAIGW